jgi:hypothetical protein
MSLHTLLYLRTISKAKKSLSPFFKILDKSYLSRMVVQKKEASHAL